MRRFRSLSVGLTVQLALLFVSTMFAVSVTLSMVLANSASSAVVRQLQVALGAMTLLGLLLVSLATWKAAGRITQPLARLDEAAGRLASGEHVQVRVRGQDELARLATSFN